MILFFLFMCYNNFNVEIGELHMIKESYDFYSPFNLKLRDLHPKVQYQLDLLASHDLSTRQHSENVANLTYRLCEYLHCNSRVYVLCYYLCFFA